VRKVLAFAGIGNPGKFFATLAEAGIDVAERAGFADHHPYTAADVQALIARAETKRLMLLTTEKDIMRLGDDPALAALLQRARALPVRLVVEEQDQFRDMVLNAVRRARP
jgi:tetraacyldisaccharide 4'-kinase